MLSSDRPICDLVAMLSRSSGLKNGEVCAIIGNHRQGDRSADQLCNSEMMATKCRKYHSKIATRPRQASENYLKMFRSYLTIEM